jgi:hypothetical protein
MPTPRAILSLILKPELPPPELPPPPEVPLLFGVEVLDNPSPPAVSVIEVGSEVAGRVITAPVKPPREYQIFQLVPSEILLSQKKEWHLKILPNERNVALDIMDIKSGMTNTPSVKVIVRVEEPEMTVSVVRGA